MAFRQFSYKKIEYDKTNDSCFVSVSIDDDVMGVSEHSFILGSKHFKGKSFNSASRNSQIKILVKNAVKEYHNGMVVKYDNKVSDKIKIPPFANVNKLD